MFRRQTLSLTPTENMDFQWSFGQLHESKDRKCYTRNILINKSVLYYIYCRRLGWERCRISPPRFLAECCKRQLNQGSFVLLYFRLFTFSDLYWVCLSVFSRTVLYVSISQLIGCEDSLRYDLYCVEWGVKLYSNERITESTVRRCCKLNHAL